MILSSNLRCPLLLILCISLFSCGSDDSNTSNSSSDTNTSTLSTIQPQTTETDNDSSDSNANDPIQFGTSGSTEQPTALPIDNNDEQDDLQRNWLRADGWTNLRIANRIEKTATISFDLRAKSNNINGVAAITNGIANEYDDLALIIRMFRNGMIDVRDGDSYAAEMDLPYEANAIYNVEMIVNFDERLYDVYVTYPSGQRFPIRLSASFRTSQPVSSADQLVLYEAENDDLEVSNFKINNTEMILYSNTTNIDDSNTVETADNAISVTSPQTATSSNNIVSTENNDTTSSSETTDNTEDASVSPTIDASESVDTTEIVDTNEIIDTPESIDNTNNINTPNNTLMVDLPPLIEIAPDLPRIEVNNSSELASALGSTTGGGIIYIRSGTYSCVDLSNRNHSRTAPLLLEGIGDNVDINGGCSYPLNIQRSNYIAVRNVNVTGGLDGIKVAQSSNVILDNVDVSENRQAGIHIDNNSKDVDVINSTIHDTGNENPQWGECIYVGTGGTGNFPDQTERVWIENNNIYNCGFAEAINIKPEVFDTTIKNNRVSNISPGSTQYSQYNQSAITVEGGRGSSASNNHRPNSPRNIWVEGNILNNVSGGRWNNGIMVGGTGVNVVENVFSNITESTIWANNYGNLNLPIYLYQNRMSNSQTINDMRLSSGLNILQTDPGNNPNTRQNWLP